MNVLFSQWMSWGRSHLVGHALRVEHHVGGVMLLLHHTNVHTHIVHRRIVNGSLEILKRRLMSEMVRREALLLVLVLVLVHLERIDVRLERRMLHAVRKVCLEALESSSLPTSLHGAFRGGHGERRAQTSEGGSV